MKNRPEMLATSPQIRPSLGSEGKVRSIFTLICQDFEMPLASEGRN